MKLKFWLITILGFSLALSAFASGSYNARPPRVPAGHGGSKTDSQKYALGKKIYSGKAKLATQASADRAAQERRLQELQARLPEKVRAKVNLPQYGGRLSAAELQALEYYVMHRYPTR
jgi:hypothetical protein